jgi:hypothetical protein
MNSTLFADAESILSLRYLQDRTKAIVPVGLGMDIFRITDDGFERLIAFLNERKATTGLGVVPAKLFLSYNTLDKGFAGDLKDAMESEFSATVFLAHECLEVSQEWRGRILEELRSCDVLIALVTENFRVSNWTDQEVGHALAGGKRIVPIYTPELHGFLAAIQGIRISGTIEELSSTIGTQLHLTPKAD